MKAVFISLGCDKNTTDSEKIFKLFIKQTGAVAVLNPEEADVAIINTCSFIRDAKKESIDYIKYLISLKKSKKLKKILVLGCLASLNDKTHEYDKLFKDCDVVLSLDRYLQELDKCNDRMTDILSFSSFIKVCDGCNKFCSYCIIPYLRGRIKSNAKDNIISEVKKLALSGTKELSIVGQDILNYGYDLLEYSGVKRPIVDLVNDISKVDGIEWIRLLYCYPEDVDDEVISLLKDNHKVLPYIDIPIQHSSDKILKLMNRKTTRESIKQTIQKLRENIPDICIRTTIMVGFPGETEDDFSDLLSFVREMKFDKLGVFTYSREELSKSYDLPNQVDEKIKNERKRIILNEQKKIVEEINKTKANKVYYSIVEGKVGENKYLVRPYFNARNIDDKVYALTNEELISGTFVNVEIKKVKGYDLEGVIV